MESLDALPFAAHPGTEPGQQSFFRLKSHRAPLPPSAVLSLAGVPLVPDWTPEAAARTFKLLMPQVGWHAETAYETLLDAGCPLALADATWTAWDLRQ